MPTNAPNGLTNSYVVGVGRSKKQPKKAAAKPEPVAAVEPAAPVVEPVAPSTPAA